MPPQDPRELGSLEECRNRRLIAGLAGVVEEVVGTQGALVRAVDQLERRSRPVGVPRRRFRPRASLANVLVFALVFGVLFTLGSATLPEGPMPAAEAETSRPPRKAAPTTTTAAQAVPSRPRARRGVLQQPTTTAPATTQAEASSVAAVTSRPVTSTILPAEPTSSSLPVLPPVSTGPPPCKPKGCGDEG